ncbi:MAG: DUF4290 domain-containing protein [Bacteroidia bacterium]|nr:DUF4290 domain-containing protein [Bacteroidia bacterium]
MQYKISDQPLRLREFGRNVQALVEHACTIGDRTERNRVANEIVKIVTWLNPQLKDIPDFKQKIWDAIVIASDFKLDIDAPYPVPSAEVFHKKPEQRMPYYKEVPRFRQYGINLEKMIAKAVEMPEGPVKSQYINMIANAMKLFLRNTDRESLPETAIMDHIRELSRGKLSVRLEDINFVRVYSNNFPQNSSNTGSRRQHSGNNPKNKNRNNNRNKQRRRN